MQPTFRIIEGSPRRGQLRFFVARFRVGEKIAVDTVFAGNTREEAEARKAREVSYWAAQAAIAQI